MDTYGGTTTCRPLLTRRLGAAASSQDRSLFGSNRASLVEAVMSHWVLVPEGRLDFEWLRRLSVVADAQVSSAPPFGAVFGIVPTKDAAVTHVVDHLRRLRTRIAALVDGDPAGDGYVRNLLHLTMPPDRVLQWQPGAEIEDVVVWIVEGGGGAALSAAVTELAPWVSVSTVEELRAALKSKCRPGGIKDDLLAHEALATVIAAHQGCRDRTTALCDALVAAVQQTPHLMLQPGTSGATVRVNLC